MAVDDELAQLESIIAKYQRLPMHEFLLYEAYIDYGYDSNGQPQASLIFEVKEINDEDLSAALVEADDPTGKTKPSEPLRITALSSALNPGKKYVVLTGRQIAERASRLKSLLELHLVQPPGKTSTGEQHLALDVDSYNEADPVPPPEIQYRCSDNKLMRPNRVGEYRKKVTLNGLRRGSSSRIRIKIMQDMLLNMGYGDEMRFEVYEWDGRYGKRTSLAVSAFMREIAYLKKSKPESSKGEFITTALSKALIHRCETRWQRFNYKVFLGTNWILKERDLSKEMTWLRWRHHTTQLQTDLVNLSIATANGARLADDKASGIADLSTVWEWGKYVQYTAEAVRRFQTAALQGCRYDPINQLIVYSLSEPTYQGNVSGIVDEETKVELIRWFDAVEQLTHVEDVTVLDRVTPDYDLSDAAIESPMVGSCGLVHVGGNAELIISAPGTIDTKPLNAAALKENLPYYLFLHRPVDDKRPFLYDNHQTSYAYDYHYTVTGVEEVSDISNMQFYTGTLNEHKPEKYTAEKIDSGASAFGAEERGLRKDMQGNDIENINAELIEKYRRIYDRQYPGFADKLAQDGRKLWKVQLQLADSVEAGIHLFKINGGSDRKPHPVSVIPKDKDTFDILHLTDLHIAARHEEIDSYLGDKEDYNNPNERFRDILSRVNQGELAADMVIITGDLIDCTNNYRPYDVVDGRHIFTPVFDKDANWRLLHYYLTTDPGISVPVYMCLGNHDYRPNPTSINNYKNDLNIREEEVELYPFDTRDRSVLDEPAQKWLLARCFSDSLYADKNAAQYYFENICPFTDYRIQLGKLNFLFMDTGMDENIFVGTYGVEDIGMLFDVIFGHNPPPQSVGFSQRQLEWLVRSLADSSENSNILCMHSPVIKPPVSKMVPRYDSPSFMENEISDSVAAYNESCLIGGRSDLLEMIDNGSIRLILTGHTHINFEIRCNFSQSPAKYYVGNYSDYKMNLDYFNEQGNSLLLSTISSGVVGYELDIELDSYFDSFEKKDIVKYFSHSGYRLFGIGANGAFMQFGDQGAWHKHGGFSAYLEKKTLFEALEDIIEKYKEQILADGELKVNDKTIISEEERVNAKIRFIQYRCRKYVRLQYLGGKAESNGTMLDENKQKELDRLTDNIIQRFQRIEEVYINEVYTDTPNKNRLVIPLFDYHKYRNLTTWQIMFSLVAVYYDNIVTSTALALHTSIPLLEDPLKEKLLENIERRLRIAERLRYYVGGTNEIETQRFKYPPPGFNSERAACSVQGAAPSDNVLKLLNDSEKKKFGCGSDKSAWWIQMLPPDHTCNFKLSACGIENPFDAIERIFAYDFLYYSHNFCERVLHILHLDDFSVHLIRTNRQQEMFDLASKGRIAIVNPWHTKSNIIGSGSSTDTNLPIINTESHDPYFERNDHLRLDELTIGDQIELLNHPVYRAAFITGAWQLENAMVLQFKDEKISKELRYKVVQIPRDIEVKGHGAGPLMFNKMQEKLLDNIQYVHEIIHGVIRGEFANYDKEGAKKVMVPQKWADDASAPIPYNMHVSKKDIIAGKFKEDEDFSPYLNGMSANIEFRREYASPGTNFVEREKLAFWIRFKTDIPGMSTSSWEKDYWNWIKEMYSNTDSHGDKRYPNPASAKLFSLPFIDKLVIDAPRREIVISGLNLEKERIRSLYFTSMPRIINDKTEHTNQYANSSDIHSILGGYEVTWDEINGMRIDESGNIVAPLPPDSSGARMAQEPALYWKPVLRVSLFDPEQPSVKGMVAMRLHHELANVSRENLLSWYESLDDQEYKHHELKNIIAFLQMEVRSEFAFRWPHPENTIARIDPVQIQQARFTNDPVPILGHPYFNTAYIPIYRKQKDGQITEIRPVLEEIPNHLGNFYKMDESNRSIRVIRPRFDTSNAVP